LVLGVNKLRAEILKMKLGRWIYPLMLFIDFAAYEYVWIYISLMKYYSLNAMVYDLGTAAEGLYLVFHPALETTFGYIQSFLRSELIFLFAPISLLPDTEIILLILQSFALGIPIFFIYGIAREHKISPFYSLLLSISYSIYFPLAGVNWNDFHFQAFFIPFFISAYYFYLVGRKKLSFTLFILAGIVRFPYIIFIILFAIIEYVSLHNYKSLVKWKSKFILVLLVVSLGIFLVSFFILGGVEFILGQAHVIGVSSSIPISFYTKIKTVALIFVPVLMLPLFSKKWVLFFLPYLLLILYSPIFAYTYPFAFRMQYSSMFIPFIFLSIIDVISELDKKEMFNKIIKIKSKVFIFKTSKNQFKCVVAIFFSILLFATVFEPYGPFNGEIQGTFNFRENTDANFTLYNDYISLAKLIPPNEGAVLIQNNMPQILPRPLPAKSGIIMDTGTLTTFGNINQSDIAMNSFPLFFNNAWHNVEINYLIADPWSDLSYSVQPMMNFVTSFREQFIEIINIRGVKA